MAILAQWDKIGEHFYETGVDRGMLYQFDKDTNSFKDGVVWNGLTAVNESPSGAEANDQYADNIKYLSLRSAEEFGATIEAFTYPDEFGQNDGTAEPVAGVTIAQQTRKAFGFSYRTLIGNDVDGTDLGYKIHLVYQATANPSEKSRSTVNDSPEATTFSWEITTMPVEVGTVNGIAYKKTAHITIDSTKFKTEEQKATLAAFEEIIYGKAADATAGTEAVPARLPLPAEVFALLSTVVVTPEVVLSSHEVTVVASGDPVTITATTVPADAAVTWASDDPTDVSVVDGVISGLAEGTATVTATITVDGVPYADSCHVTVTAE